MFANLFFQFSNVLIDVVENHFQIKNIKWEVNKNVCNEYM